MKLLYLWIEKTEKDCFENNEFNFSNKFNFSFNLSSQELCFQKIDFYDPFKKISNLEGISAVVGPNGSGKTTLLETILNLPCYSIPKIKAQTNPEYLLFSQKSIIENSYIAIFEDEFNNLKIINNTRYKVKFNNETHLPGSGAQILNDVSRLLISNVPHQPFLFKNDKLIEMGYVDDLVIKETSNIFYESKIPNNSRLRAISSLLKGRFKFEDILIFDYYSNTSINLEGILKNSSIQFHNLLNFLVTFRNETTNKSNENFELFDCIIQNTRSLQNEFIREKNYIDVLKMDFICELIAFDPKINLNNFNNLNDAYKHCQDIVDRNEDKKEIIYFKNAQKEINILEECKHTTESNKLPPLDLAYTVKRRYDIKKLKKYFDFVCESEYSFSIKYLMFQPCSSNGELGLVEMLSRLDFVFNISRYISSSNNFQFAKNVIIMFDEIEISMHPDWQRKMIKYILNEINKKYVDKNIQIIFSTHSPILLSDLPSCSINYINYDYKTKKRNVFRLLDKKTFGMNIFDLYRDAFFFDNGIAMGQFAIDYINDLTRRIKDFDPFVNDKEIELIGDDFIRNQLYKLQDSKPTNNRAIENVEIVKALREQRDTLDSLIRKFSK